MTQRHRLVVSDTNLESVWKRSAAVGSGSVGADAAACSV